MSKERAVYRLRHNDTTVHITGMRCPALARHATLVHSGERSTDLAEILAKARANSRYRLCAHCERSALKQLAEQAPAPAAADPAPAAEQAPARDVRVSDSGIRFRTRGHAVADSMAFHWGREWHDLAAAEQAAITADYIDGEDKAAAGELDAFDMRIYRANILPTSLAGYAALLLGQAERAAQEAAREQMKTTPGAVYVDEAGDRFAWWDGCWMINGAPFFGLPAVSGRIRPLDPADSPVQTMRDNPGARYRDEAGTVFRCTPAGWFADGARIDGEPSPVGAVVLDRTQLAGVQPIHSHVPASGMDIGWNFVGALGTWLLVWWVNDKRSYTDEHGVARVEFTCVAVADLDGWPRREWATLDYQAGEMLSRVAEPVEDCRSPWRHDPDAYGVFDLQPRMVSHSDGRGGHVADFTGGEYLLIADPGDHKRCNQVWRVITAAVRPDGGMVLDTIRVGSRDGWILRPERLQVNAEPGEELIVVGRPRLRPMRAARDGVSARTR